MVNETRSKAKVRTGWSDKILYMIIGFLMLLLCLVILYPLTYVVSCSFSDGNAIAAGRVFLWPVEPTTVGYQLIFNYRSVWTGYRNTFFVTIVATIINMILTMFCAYPLSRKNLQGKKFYMIFFMVPMFFSGGIVPGYFLMVKLGLLNTYWSLILSGALSIYNMIIMRTFFQNSIPEELFEAAKMDGITDIAYLFKIVIPLSKAVFSVIILYYAVGHWNSYFNALLYIRNPEMWPLQLVLREILNAGKISPDEISDPNIIAALRTFSEGLKYSLMVIASVPVLLMYPFVQKYFEKGVMIGSVKG